MCKHSPPAELEHPEIPERIRAIWNKLESAGIPQRCEVFKAKQVEDKYIRAVHSQNHSLYVKTNIYDSKKSVYFNEGSSKSAYLAVGSVLQVAEKVAKGELDSAFAIVRPPGRLSSAPNILPAFK
nr:histone deacetylase 5 [Tanacetum cinerariifolium]